MAPASTIATTATFLVSIPAASAGVRAYRAFGGLREISCPETMDAALVRINVIRAIASRLSGGNELRLRSCSRWPGKQAGDQPGSPQTRPRPAGAALARGQRGFPQDGKKCRSESTGHPAHAGQKVAGRKGSRGCYHARA